MHAGAKLGQHFLRDEDVLARMASAAVAPDDTVVEVGPAGELSPGTYLESPAKF